MPQRLVPPLLSQPPPGWGGDDVPAPAAPARLALPRLPPPRPPPRPPPPPGRARRAPARRGRLRAPGHRPAAPPPRPHHPAGRRLRHPASVYDMGRRPDGPLPGNAVAGRGAQDLPGGAPRGTSRPRPPADPAQVAPRRRPLGHRHAPHRGAEAHLAEPAAQYPPKEAAKQEGHDTTRHAARVPPTR